MKRYIGPLAIVAMCVAGCATKRYPVATPMSPAAFALMDCGDLQHALLETDEIELQIADTAQPDWRSGVAIMTDFGIGNKMAASEARRALAQRRWPILLEYATRNCRSAIPGRYLY